MPRRFVALVCSLSVLTFLVAGCVTRAADVLPLPANPSDYALWDCDRMHDEQDLVQQRATEVAYAVDQRAGNNILALGVGLAVFWPALLALRPAGPEAQDLARFKGRFDALETAVARKGCAPVGSALSAAQAAQVPLVEGEQLVYEERRGARGPVLERSLWVRALRRTEFEFQSDGRTATATATLPGRWLQDRVGNLMQVPDGALQWRHLLTSDLTLGQVGAGDMLVAGDTLSRARVRSQVVAMGPQMVAGRRFDAVVLELFGDATRAESSTRVDGAMVIDRSSGLLLRLDLRSANPDFNVQRRLLRVLPALP